MSRALVLIIILAAVTILTYQFVLKDRWYGNYGRVTIGEKSFRVEVADTDEKRIAGLAGRSSLAAIDGMLFTFDTPAIYPFTMKGMNFPLDFVWVNNGKITDYTLDAGPDKGEKIYSPSGEVSDVLEFPAGTVKRYSFDLGERVKIELPNKASN